MSIFETIGIAYTIMATSLFTVELIYCSAKGLNSLRHLLARGQGGEERRGGGLSGGLSDVNSKNKHVVKIPM